jgi:histidinol-phosphate aminotransferase
VPTRVPRRLSGSRAVPLPPAFEPYVWAATADDVAARRGLSAAQVLRFDANVPPLPGVPQVPLSRSFERLHEYPEGTYRELREAAAAYVGVQPEQIVVGAGADGLIGLVARTFLASGRRAAVIAPTYPLYAIASSLAGAECFAARLDPAEVAGADVVWVCNPNNPTGELVPAEDLAAVAERLPSTTVVVDEAYFEYAGAESVVPLLARTPNLIAIRTLSKAFGLASLRVGYAVASRDVAGELDRRREPAPVSGPGARIAAAALRAPRLDIEETIAERERVRAALEHVGFDCPPVHANFVYVRTPAAEGLAEELEAKGLVVRRHPGAIRITIRLPAENDVLLAALGAAPEPSPRRSALVVRTTTETAIRVSVELEGEGRGRVLTGVGFLDHLLTQLAFHGGLDLEVVGAGDLEVDEHHTVEDVLAALGAALDEALREREGIARFGSATVPMDEARASAAVDLVRRPHADVRLAFKGDRVGALAPTLLPHALERLAIEGRFTLHVEAAGEDDHHVAEAAFKALGRALRQACASERGVARSTRGET